MKSAFLGVLTVSFRAKFLQTFDFFQSPLITTTTTAVWGTDIDKCLSFICSQIIGIFLEEGQSACFRRGTVAVLVI